MEFNVIERSYIAKVLNQIDEVKSWSEYCLLESLIKYELEESYALPTGKVARWHVQRSHYSDGSRSLIFRLRTFYGLNEKVLYEKEIIYRH